MAIMINPMEHKVGGLDDAIGVVAVLIAGVHNDNDEVVAVAAMVVNKIMKWK